MEYCRFSLETFSDDFWNVHYEFIIIQYNYNNIDDEELVDFNRRIANVILNEQEIEEAEKELKLHEDALNSLREHDALSTKKRW